MKRLLPILIVFLTALIGCKGDTMNAEANISEGTSVAYSARGYSLSNPQQGRHNEATLNETLSIYRLCNTRPGRLIPTLGSNSGKSAARSFAGRKPGIKRLFFLHDGRRRLETAPFQSAASRDYYVFALRRILC